MKSTHFLFFLVLTATSCTMEKRLHNPGWNVQWHSKHISEKSRVEKASKEMASTEDRIENRHEKSEVEKTPNLLVENVQLALTRSIRIHLQSEQVSATDYRRTLNEIPIFQDPEDTTKKRLTTSPTIQETVETPNLTIGASVNSEFGLRMLLYGGICAVLAVVCYFAAVGGGTGAVLYFFGTAVFGAVGAILLLVGLITLLATFLIDR